MPNTPVSDQNIGWYLSGYTDGEGSFCVSFSPREKLLAKLEVRPSFSVSQNGDRKEVLVLFQKRFNCGTIRPDRSDKTLKYEVRSLKSLTEKIIPHFQKYPLLSSKQKDFERFSYICQIMKENKHRYKKYLQEIIRIACKMNSGEFRRYKKEQLLKLIR